MKQYEVANNIMMRYLMGVKKQRFFEVANNTMMKYLMSVKKQRFFGSTVSLSCYQNPKLKIYGEEAMTKMTMIDSSLGEQYKASMRK
jgi:hypothetical protein